MDAAYDDLRKQYPLLPATLKYEQAEIIQHIIDTKNVLGVLPTGFGKTLTFAVPPLFKDGGVSLVISPLRALMADQVQSLQKMGISAVALMGENTSDDVKSVKSGNAQVVLMTPEGLLSWTDVINTEGYRAKLVVIAFDEVHMLPEWGETFRLAYLNVVRLRSFFEDVPILMLTATLPENTLHRALHILSFTKDDITEVFRTPDRPNIKLMYKSTTGMEMTSELGWYLEMLATRKQQTPKCIVYVNSSLSALGRGYSNIRSYLQERAFQNDRKVRHELQVEVYTASLPTKDRQRVLDEFKKENSCIRCLFCTMAFGMGVDIPDIRYVILWGAPTTVPDAWQQIGRAGRDGSASEAYLLFTRTSLASQRVQADVRSLVKSIKDTNCLRRSILTRVSYREIHLEPSTEASCCVNLSNDGHDFHTIPV